MEEKKQLSVDFYNESWKKLQAIQDAIDDFANHIDKTILTLPVNWELPIKKRVSVHAIGANLSKTKKIKKKRLKTEVYTHTVGVTVSEIRQMKKLRKKFISYALRDMFKQLSNDYYVGEHLSPYAEIFQPFMRGLIYENLSIKVDYRDEKLEQIKMQKEYNETALSMNINDLEKNVFRAVEIIFSKMEYVINFITEMYDMYKDRVGFQSMKKSFEIYIDQLDELIINPLCEKELDENPYGWSWGAHLDICVMLYIREKYIHFKKEDKILDDNDKVYIPYLSQASEDIAYAIFRHSESSVSVYAFEVWLKINDYIYDPKNYSTDEWNSIDALIPILRDKVTQLKQGGREISHNNYSISMQDKSGSLLKSWAKRAEEDIILKEFVDKKIEELKVAEGLL